MSGAQKHISVYHYLRNLKTAYFFALIPSFSFPLLSCLLPNYSSQRKKKLKKKLLEILSKKQNVSIKLHAKSSMLLLRCIFYIESPDISSPSVSTGVLVSRPLTLDNVEDLHIVCRAAELLESVFFVD